VLASLGGLELHGVSGVNMIKDWFDRTPKPNMEVIEVRAGTGLIASPALYGQQA
jgi:hypothetical protein